MAAYFAALDPMTLVRALPGTGHYLGNYGTRCLHYISYT